MVGSVLRRSTFRSRHKEKQDPTIEKTEGGLVRGAYRNGALKFCGSLYAVAPSGDLRWAAPQPAAPWNEIRDASQFGPAEPT